MTKKSAMIRVVPAVMFLSAAVLPAYAHHSEVMFAPDREVLLTGTVKEFRYTNPHSYIQIVVPREGGQLVLWNIETDPPIALDRAGIESTTLQPGVPHGERHRSTSKPSDRSQCLNRLMTGHGSRNHDRDHHRQGAGDD